MKVLICTDIHCDKSALASLRELARGVEFIICAGDMSLWGRGLDATLEVMASWGKRVFVIHGNHEDELDTRTVCSKFENLTFFHRDVVQFKDLSLVGWGGGGFSLQDRGFERFVEGLKISEFSRVVLVTHGPPFQTCLDEKQPGVFVGCESYKRFILKHNPLVAISGHIHETEGAICELEGSILINPGPFGVVLDL
ncbi:MAG: metallophosphoesterase [Candidatus Woesearchaeota archaeon]